MFIAKIKKSFGFRNIIGGKYGKITRFPETHLGFFYFCGICRIRL